MGHVAVPPTTNLDPPDVVPFNDLTKAMAQAASYTDVQDDYATTLNLDGCGVLNGYASYGDAGDWLYKDYRTRALSIEAYNKVERGTCPTGSWDYNFGPVDAAKRDTVADNNVQGWHWRCCGIAQRRRRVTSN